MKDLETLASECEADLSSINIANCNNKLSIFRVRGSSI